MTTVEQIIEKAGGARLSTRTRNKILNAEVEMKHAKKGYKVVATAVADEGERAGCVHVKDAKGAMWRPLAEYVLD